MKKFRGFRVRVRRSLSHMRSQIHRYLSRKNRTSYLRLRNSESNRHSPSRPKSTNTATRKLVTRCQEFIKHLTFQKRYISDAASRPPKGHLIVYVGGTDPPRRVLVPVVYFNHPLFGELLKESEKVYGFHHPGVITIPCPISDFEKVRNRVEASSNFNSSSSRWRNTSEKKLHQSF